MKYSQEIVQAVWEKARGMNDHDASEWRKDECGAWIRRDQYGKEVSEFGWKIEAVTAEESPTVENLRAFQHQNSYLLDTREARCMVTADREGIAPTASIDTPRNKAAD
ncbi:MAG: hypothetical protein PVJ63_01410 [Thioalkalispiraceae bacterium]|jgi:hypothetical protein